jgi:hypothetical protein
MSYLLPDFVSIPHSTLSGPWRESLSDQVSSRYSRKATIGSTAAALRAGR